VRADARQPFSDECGVDEQPVFEHHVRKPPAIRIDAETVVLQSNPTPQEEGGKSVLRFAAERRRCLESAAVLRRVYPEQPDSSHACNHNGVAVYYRLHEKRIGTRWPPARLNG
jgi:hypothetical protein